MKKYLLKVAKLLLRYALDKALVEAAKGATTGVENRWAGNGPAKRFAVYEELLNSFPSVPKTDVSLAIEAVLESK